MTTLEDARARAAAAYNAAADRYMHGYYFSQPVPAEEIPDLAVRDWSIVPLDRDAALTSAKRFALSIASDNRRLTDLRLNP